MLDDGLSDEAPTPRDHGYRDDNSLAGEQPRVTASHPLPPTHQAHLGRTPKSAKEHNVNVLLSSRVPLLMSSQRIPTHVSQRTGPVTIFNKNRPRRQDRAQPQDTLYDLQQGQAWLAYRLVGGIRGDPFNSLPDTRDCVPAAIDHLVQVFIPERILRPFGAVPGIEHLAYDYFQLIIHDRCVFEANVAQAQASFVVSQGHRKPTKEVLHHHGKALVLLGQRLADPVERFDDAVIHAILAIIGTHFFFMELDQHQSHLDGLWNLIRMRGGIDTLGWHGTLKQAVETVTSFRAYHTKVQSPAPTTDTEASPTSSFTLNYLTHPFPTSVTNTISKLPEGFCEVALKRTLSVQIIDLIADIHEQNLMQLHSPVTESVPSKHHIYEADKCVAFLKATTMPDLERMICGGLLAYTMQSHISPALLSSGTRTTAYDETLRNFMLELSQYIYFNYDDEALLWVVYCVSFLQKHILQDYRPDFFYHNILRFKQSGKWRVTEVSLKKFLWTEERLTEWEKYWQECRANHNAQGFTPATTPGLTSDSKSPSVWQRSSHSPEKTDEVMMESELGGLNRV